MEPGLYVVATPIGNLGDISERALQVLRSADLVAAEDTRHSQRLLQHFGIAVQLVPYHDHSDQRAQDRIGRTLADGGIVALVSDAGTPLISDPGYRLVRAMQDRGHPVLPVPGPCAAVAALSVSGLPTDRFLFEGFLPARPGPRDRRLEQVRGERATLVFYEAPHRIAATLEAMAACFGGTREAMLAREITKTFETLVRGSLDDLCRFVAQDANQRRGEIVLVVAGQAARPDELDEANAALLRTLAEELPAKRAAAIVAEHSGLRKNRLYDYLLQQRDD